MASIMRIRFAVSQIGTSHPTLFQTFWRPGTSGGSVADATDCLARVRSILNSNISNLAAGVLFTPNTEADVLEDTTGAITGTWTGANPGTVTGTLTGDNASPALAFLIKANTNLIVGRRFLKGRTYLPGVSEASMQNGGAPDSTRVTAWNNAFNALLTGGTTASFPVIWHRPHPKGASNGTSGPVISYQCNPSYLGVQRRRRF